jgi:hypothetical protein
MLGGIDTDNGEVLTTYFLDTRADDSIGLLQRLSVTWLGFALLTAGSSDVVHAGFSIIEESKGADLNFPSQQSKLPTLQKKYFGDLSVIPGRVICWLAHCLSGHRQIIVLQQPAKSRATFDFAAGRRWLAAN